MKYIVLYRRERRTGWVIAPREFTLYVKAEEHARSITKSDYTPKPVLAAQVYVFEEDHDDSVPQTCGPMFWRDL